MHFDSIREFELLSASLSADEEQAMANLSGLGTLNDNRITVARMHMNLIALPFQKLSKAATYRLVMGMMDSIYDKRHQVTFFSDFSSDLCRWV